MSRPVLLIHSAPTHSSMSSSSLPIALKSFLGMDGRAGGYDPVSKDHDGAMSPPSLTPVYHHSKRSRKRFLWFGIAGLTILFVYLFLVPDGNSIASLDVPEGTEKLWALGLPPQHLSTRYPGYLVDPATIPVQNAVERGLHVRDLHVHFLNHHSGTASELQVIFETLSNRNNVKLTFKESMGVFTKYRGMGTSRLQANLWWPSAMTKECNVQEYDMVIVGDTMPLIRPLVQNCCPLPMVAWLTTRFDWGLERDAHWHEIVQKASYWSNFRIHANNLLEDWYQKSKNFDIKMYDYVPSSGIPNSYWSKALNESYTKGNNSYFLPSDDSFVAPTTVRIPECLFSKLDKLKIPYHTWQRNKYGGPLGLTDRVLAQVPYQSNTMSLFENLSQRVAYLLPSVRLYRELGKDCGAHIEKVDNDDLTDEVFADRVDWWRRDLKHLYYYFDSFEDLIPGSPFRKHIEATAQAKRVAIASHMVRQREYVLRQWEDILFGDWATKKEADPSCVPDPPAVEPK